MAQLVAMGYVQAIDIDVPEPKTLAMHLSSSSKQKIIQLVHLRLSC